jgi:small subunit ribosomal protein S11
MSEDTKHKNTKTQKQEDKEVVGETAEVKVGKKEDKSLKTEKEERNPLGMGETEELPEDIKKKLAEKKEEKAKKKFKRKKKAAKTVKSGRAYIKATYNNTIVTLTDLTGNVLSWASAGIAGFKGAKKSTPYAAQIITKIAVTSAREEFGLEEVNVFVKGVGTGRESAVRALNANGLNITAIKDITPVPHNGCRPKKPRRV